MVRGWSPPPSLPGMFRYCVRIVLDGVTPYLLDKYALALVPAEGAAVTAPHHLPFQSGCFSWYRGPMWAGFYRVRVRVPAIGAHPALEMWFDPSTGRVLDDPTWPGATIPPEASDVFIEPRHPDDFRARCAIALDCPDDHATGITDGTLSVGDQPFVTGPGPGVPPALQRFYRGTVAPGTYAVRFSGSVYALPSATTISANATLVSQRLVVRLTAPPVDRLLIHGDAFFVGVGEFVDLQTDMPAPWASHVEWQSSATAALQPTETPGRFRGHARGVATVTARYGALQASVVVAVRADAQAPVLRPVLPAQIQPDPWVGGHVAAGEVLAAFRPETSAAAITALVRELGLMQVGIDPLTRSYQLAYDPATTTLEAIVRRLSGDARVARVAPNLVLSYASIPAYRPTEVPSGNPYVYWHLHKMEADAAFGLMQAGFERRDSAIGMIDSGLWVSPDHQFHVDLAGRVDVMRSFAQGFLGPEIGMNALSDAGTGAPPKYHGNMVAGAAVAAWDNGGAVGIDPKAELIMAKPTEGALVLFNIGAALPRLARLLDARFRVVCLTFSSAYLPDLANAWCVDAVRTVLQGRGLLVIAAGNANQDVRNEGLASIKAALTDDEAERVIVVGATGVELGSEAGLTGPETRLVYVDDDGKTKGSNFAPPGPGHLVDLAAPGRSIFASGAGHGVQSDSGTSLSAPLVAAVANVLFSILPVTTDAAQVRQLLIDTSDPIVYDAHPSFSPRLRAEPDRHIGVGRVNFWQALLAGLNTREALAHSDVRHVGLRVTADRHDLWLYLDGERITEASVENSETSTRATRVTLRARPGAFPEELVGKVGGNEPAVYRRPLRLEGRAIEALQPRYVVTARMYTRGKVRLLQESDAALAPNRCRLTIANDGTPPTEPELLDPETRSPWDRSLRPWMRLADGDSFTIEGEVDAGPDGTTATVLDAQQHPLPPAPVDDDGTPYLTVPFAARRSFHVSARFPTDAMPATARVRVTVTSLNNRVVSDAWSCELRSVPPLIEIGDAAGMLNGPLKWWKFGMLRLRNTAATPLSMSLTYDTEPPEWAYGAGRDVDLGPGQQVSVQVKFGPHSNVPVGATGRCLIRGTSGGEGGVLYRHQFVGTVGAPPSVIVSPATTRVNVVRPVPGTAFVVAEFPIQIENRSPYPVMLWRRYHEVTGALAAHHAEWLQLAGLFSSDMRRLAAGETAACTVRLHYDAALASPPQATPTVARHQITLLVVDPNEEVLMPTPPLPPPGWSGYEAAPFSAEIVLRLAP